MGTGHADAYLQSLILGGGGSAGLHGNLQVIQGYIMRPCLKTKGFCLGLSNGLAYKTNIIKKKKKTLPTPGQEMTYRFRDRVTCPRLAFGANSKVVPKFFSPQCLP